MRASYVRGGGGLALAVFVLACGGAAPAAVFDNADARAVGVADGDDITGDVKINGNNSYIFGQGADVSVIAGNVEINKNNAGVRGVRIKGNYIVEFNNATLVLGVVEGNVIIRGNNAVIAETVVLGNIEISGNNTVLVGNYVKGNIEITGKNTRCDNNRAFVDANDDKLYQPGEEGTVLTCGG